MENLPAEIVRALWDVIINRTMDTQTDFLH